MLRICNNYCKDDIRRMWMMMYIIMESQKHYGHIYKIEFPNEKHYGAREKNSDSRGKNKPFDVFAKDGTFVRTFKYQFKVIEYMHQILLKF